MRKVLTGTLLLLIVFPAAFGQSINATVSGTVTDATGALIPGVTVTASNAATGVTTNIVSNDSGAYNFPSLQPGVYKVTAELQGFQTQTFTDVQLGNAQQVRLNFMLNVAGVNTALEVTIGADVALATSSATIGGVLPEQKVSNLPLVGRDVLDLVGVLPGIRLNPEPIFGGETTTFAGISAADVNVQRDGITVNDTRYPVGISSTTRINPDLVGEVRMVLTPVDAELGRGNGQVQILTRSGTNDFRGSAVWNVQNSALYANNWGNNRTRPRTEQDWKNVHQWTGRYGGPIVKNKTFFFALYDGQFHRTREVVNSPVLTDTARKGVYRYFPGWNNGNAIATVNAAGTNPVTRVVDVFGNVARPAANPDGSPYTQTMRCVSVFGAIKADGSPFTAADCPGGQIILPASATSWDGNRPAIDSTGFVRKTLALMPSPNVFDSAANAGDGLNTAVYRYVRRRSGVDNLFGVTDDNGRNQYNIKIDQNFSQKHKASVSWTYERTDADDWMSPNHWPSAFRGHHNRRPQVWTSSFSSTLSSTLLNEARFGVRRNTTGVLSSLDNPATKDAIKEYLPTINNKLVQIVLGTGAIGTTGVNFPSIIATTGTGVGNSLGDITSLWTWADSLSWNRGKHSFKGGFEFRYASSLGFTDACGGGQTRPVASGGAGQTPVAGINNTNQTGLLLDNDTRLENLMMMFAGSLNSINQCYFINSPTKLDAWISTDRRERELRQHEWSVFYKDDWKVTSNLTLNMGIRYDYYGAPYAASGLTAAILGGGPAIFGVSGRSFDDWFKPGIRADLTKLEFVGPGSPNPNKQIWPNDRDNFGPAFGFAYNLPWFGRDKTTLRGGYQLTYQGGNRFNELEGPIANPPGSSYGATINQLGGSNTYLDLTDLQAGVPVPTAILPMQPLPITDRTQSLTSFDPHYVNPYIQNFTLSITRSLSNSMLLDVRYVGTKATKLYSDIPINTRNFLTNGLLDAFNAARNGGNSQLLTDMFFGLNVGGQVVNGTTWTGAQAMRASTQFQTNLALGNYGSAVNGVANTLNTLNAPVQAPAGVNGALLRNSGKFPENFIVANPQLANATLKSNSGYSNYHSLQTQFTVRPAHGITYQSTYTWSRGLATPVGGAAWTNPADRSLDYTLQSSHRAHDFRTNATFDLPFGPNRKLFSGSSGALARLIENWQTSAIVRLTSGAPISVVANSMLYGNGTPDVVGPFSVKKGKVYWEATDAGNYFKPGTYTKVRDPQCALVDASIRNLCTLNAIALVNADGTTGPIVLQNPQPGKRGTLGRNTMEGNGVWVFDAAMSKSIRLTESKSLVLRIDAQNVFNHPTPMDPNLDLNSTQPFGNIAAKFGGGGIFNQRSYDTPPRAFQAQLRLNF